MLRASWTVHLQFYQRQNISVFIASPLICKFMIFTKRSRISGCFVTIWLRLLYRITRHIFAIIYTVGQKLINTRFFFSQTFRQVILHINMCCPIATRVILYLFFRYLIFMFQCNCIRSFQTFWITSQINKLYFFLG